MSHRFTATCIQGLEQALAEELSELGATKIKIVSQAVQFHGSLTDGYRACLWSRTASRILLRLRGFPAPDVRALYGGIRSFHWDNHLGPDSTLAITFIGTSPTVRNSHFGAMKTKDAICDSLRDRTGARPSIDLEAPDVRVHVHLHGDDATLSLDLSGTALHLRGHGRDGGPAPLRETLAAGILHYANWRGDVPLLDPMCGSGTFLSEAHEIAADRAAGLKRTHWGFLGWRGHDDEAWKELISEAHSRVRPVTVPLYGFDRDPKQVERARRNLSGRGEIPIGVRELRDARPPDGPEGILVTNPPYGERLKDGDVAETWGLLGNVLRRRFLGWTAYILAGSTGLVKCLGLRPARRHILYNGALNGRLLEVPISGKAVARDTTP